MVAITKATKGYNEIPEELSGCSIEGQRLVENIKRQLLKDINSPIKDY